MSYKEWKVTAELSDEKNSFMEWRRDDDSELFHPILLREHIVRLKELIASGNGIECISLLKESLARHFGELNNSKLYETAQSGTKFVITEYLDMVERAIEFVSDNEFDNISDLDKINLFEEGNRIHGNSALLLSGGGAFGIYHLGVIKALLEEKLIPKILSGSSMGAIVAGCACTKTDSELKEMFDHPEAVHKTAIRFYSPEEVKAHKSILDPEKLKEHIEANVKDYTFLEAYKKTGRALNVTVSATRKMQKPRILNYISTPHLLVRQSILASCALPGIFPPVMLLAKNTNGEVVPYMESETWIDGSVHLDIPMQRIMRLNNVSRSIVSQANPHVLPFLGIYESQGFFSFFATSLLSYLQNSAKIFMQLSINFSESMPWISILDKIRSMMEQEYKGDINIYYPMKAEDIFKVFANPNNEEYIAYLTAGEQATYPKMEFIRDQLRLNRVLEKCIKKLQNKSKK